jgi:hypothetical protein
MAKELAPVDGAKKVKFRSIEEIMRDPKAKATLSNLVDEAVQCKQKIEAQQQIIKGLREAALEDLGLKPVLFNNYVGMVYNNDYQTRKDGLEQQLTLVELVMGIASE